MSSELIAGYANYASTEAIVSEQSLAASYDAGAAGWTWTVSPVSVTFTFDTTMPPMSV